MIVPWLVICPAASVPVPISRPSLVKLAGRRRVPVCTAMLPVLLRLIDARLDSPLPPVLANRPLLSTLPP